MNNGDFLSSIAKMAGVADDNEHLVALMANKDLATADFPDDLASSIQSKILTLDSAKSNSDLHKHFKAEFFNTVDGKLNELAEKHGLGEELINTMKGTSGTFNRMDFFGENLSSMLNAKIEEAKNATDDPKAKERLEELQGQVNTANGDLAKFKETHVLKSELDEMRDGYEVMILDGSLKNMLSTYTFVDPINPAMAKTLFDQSLTEKGLHVVNKEGNLVLEKTDGTEYYNETNQKVELKGFMDATLAHHKLLKTTETPPPPASGFSGSSEIKVADDAPKGLAEGLAEMKASNDAAISQLIPNIN